MSYFLHWESKEPSQRSLVEGASSKGASAKNLKNMKMAKGAWAKGAWAKGACISIFMTVGKSKTMVGKSRELIRLGS